MAAPLAPWVTVNPRDFVQAGAEGAQAGLAAARIQQQSQQEGAQNDLASRRLALQADQEARQASQAEAQLSQQAQLAQMEMQARQQIAEKAALRSSQQIAIQNAYKQAMLGIDQSRIDQTKAVADQKMKEAALMFADEQGFANEVGRGTPVAEAFAKYPRTKASLVTSLGGQAEKDYGDIETTELPGGATAAFRRKSPGFKMITEKPSKESAIQDHTLKMRQDSLEKAASKEDIGSPERAQLERRIKDIESARIALTKGPGVTAPSPFKEGQRIRNRQDGKEYVVQDGQPVPVDESGPGDEDQ